MELNLNSTLIISALIGAAGVLVAILASLLLGKRDQADAGLDEKAQKFELWSLAEQKILDILLLMASTNLISLAFLFGTLAVAAMPALFTYMAVYDLTKERWPHLAFWAALAPAVALESTIMVAAHVSLKFYRRWRDKQQGKTELIIALCLVVAYIAGVEVIVYNLDASVWLIAAGAPILAIVMYAARGLFLDWQISEVTERQAAERQAEMEELERQRLEELERQQLERETEAEKMRLQQEHEQAEWDRKQAAQQAEWDRQLREKLELARLQAKHEEAMAKIQIVRNSGGKEPEKNVLTRRNPEYDKIFLRLKSEFGDSPITPQDVMDISGKAKSAVYELLKYGQEAGFVHQPGRGTYVINGVEK